MFVRLRDSIQGHIITFDSGVPGPDRPGRCARCRRQGAGRADSRREEPPDFPVRVMIIGHADATGQETSNLALSAARAEVVQSMLPGEGNRSPLAAGAQRRYARARAGRSGRPGSGHQPARHVHRERRLESHAPEKVCVWAFGVGRPRWCAASWRASSRMRTDDGGRENRQEDRDGRRRGGDARPVGYRRRRRHPVDP